MPGPWGFQGGYSGGAAPPPAVETQQRQPWGNRAYDWLADKGKFGQFLAGMLDANDDQRFGLRDATNLAGGFVAGGPMGVLAALGREAFSDNAGRGKGIDLFGRRDEPNPNRPLPGAGSAAGVETGQNQSDPGQEAAPRKYKGYQGPPIFGGMMDASVGGSNMDSSWGAINQRMGSGANPMNLYGGNFGMMADANQMLRNRPTFPGMGMQSGGMGGPPPGYNPNPQMEPDPSMPGVFPGGYRQGNQSIVPHGGQYPYYDPAGIPPLPPGMTRNPINPYISQDYSYTIPVAGGGPPIPVISGPQWLGPPGLPGWSPR